MFTFISPPNKQCRRKSHRSCETPVEKTADEQQLKSSALWMYWIDTCLTEKTRHFTNFCLEESVKPLCFFQISGCLLIILRQTSIAHLTSTTNRNKRRTTIVTHTRKQSPFILVSLLTSKTFAANIGNQYPSSAVSVNDPTLWNEAIENPTELDNTSN